MRFVEFTVYGLPGPQGSKSFKGMRKTADGKTRAVMVESSKKVKPWREAVMDAALEALGLDGMFDGPLRVSMVFTLPKPKSAPKRRKTWPLSPPDLSKLVRSTEDALTVCGFWRDDSRVLSMSARKVYPGEGPGALDRPGAVVFVQELEEGN